MGDSPKSPESSSGGGGGRCSSSLMESLLGLLRIRIIRGVNLAVRDVRSSDPYIVVKMSKQKLKTRVIKKDINPEWNEDLTLSVTDPNALVKLTVYDHDTFSMDDKMGDAEFDITPYIEALKMDLSGLPSGTIVSRVQPSRQNCLAEESAIVLEDGKVVQNICLRLRNVECGEVEIQLQWIDLPGSKVALITSTSTWLEVRGNDSIQSSTDVERFERLPAKTKKLWTPVWRLPGIFHYVNRFKSKLLLQRCLYKK
ncbi:protein C2-DOMAIN ABA-RELATED 4-like [Benincasa hispida]|uniref:protein C2-DOMAIN ABA-RELATED 4-like n=1 Tax=Benincasa hispida TaxID=102211 RepID=UPI0019005A61|nr:protein C2-DOMAIN ABA-RELATED 4-like [Benincasa hispida]